MRSEDFCITYPVNLFLLCCRWSCSMVSYVLKAWSVTVRCVILCSYCGRARSFPPNIWDSIPCWTLEVGDSDRPSIRLAIHWKYWLVLSVLQFRVMSVKSVSGEEQKRSLGRRNNVTRCWLPNHLKLVRYSDYTRQWAIDNYNSRIYIL